MMHGQKNIKLLSYICMHRTCVLVCLFLYAFSLRYA